MKKLQSALLLAVLAAGVSLTGCGQDDSKYDPEQVRSEVRDAFAGHQSRAAASVETTSKGFDSLQAKMKAALSPDQAEIFNSTDFDTVQERFETLDPETQKTLADLYEEYNPESGFYHYEGVADSGRAILGANALIFAVATDENDAKAAGEIEDDSIYIDDARHARFAYDDPDHDAQGTSRDVFMVKVGDDWKIDGAATYADFLKPVED